MKRTNVDRRGKILRLIARKNLTQWTIDDLAETGFPKKTLGNTLYWMKRGGIIKKLGTAEENKAIWTLAEEAKKKEPLPPSPNQEASFHEIGQQIVEILRKQDDQIKEQNDYIDQLNEKLLRLETKNMELAEKINNLTGGRITLRELSSLSRH